MAERGHLDLVGAATAVAALPTPPGRSHQHRSPLSTFTIADFLKLEVTAQGAPIVLAGKAHLDRRIRWLHVTELVDTQGLLQGGELILATGIALPQEPEHIVHYVDRMAEQGVAGLVIELGRRFTAIPSAMVKACNRRRLPLIALRREVAFVKMTEAAHGHILDGQRRLLQITAHAHERFTELGASDAGVDQLVAAAGELAEGHVIFSNLMHQVLAAYSHDGPVSELLARWSRKALDLTRVFGTRLSTEEEAVVTPVEVRGQQRGTLVLFTSGPPDAAQLMVLERAAAALAMRLLLDSDEAVATQARRTVLSDIISGRGGPVEAMHARTAALGHPTRDRHYLPLVVLSVDGDIAELATKSLEDLHLDTLAAPLDRGRWGALLLLQKDRLGPEERFAERLHELCQAAGVDRPVVARGALVSDLAAVRRSFAEADEVASACRAERATNRPKLVYSVDDVHLRGILYTLRHEPRVQTFVERTLGPLLLRDAVEGGDWVRTLAVYLRFQGNKSLAAHELGISRPTLYERLARIQRLLRLDLDDAEWRTSIYAAIMVVEATALEAPAKLSTYAERPEARRRAGH